MPANNGNSRWLNQSRYRSLSSFPKQGRNNDDARFVSGVSNVMLAYPRAQRVCIMDLLWRTRIDLLPPARLHLWCTGTTTWWGPVRLHGHSFAFLVISLSLAEISLSSSSSFYPPCNWVYDVSSFYSWQREKKEKRWNEDIHRERECLLFLSVDDVVSFSFNPKNTCYNQMGNRLGPLRHRIFTTTDENHTEEDPQHEWTTNGHFFLSAEIRSLLFFNCNQSDRAGRGLTQPN